MTTQTTTQKVQTAILLNNVLVDTVQHGDFIESFVVDNLHLLFVLIYFFLTENYKSGYKFELMKQCNKLIALLYRLAVCLFLLKTKFSGGISSIDYFV